jgi:hypothetical protein
LEEGEAGQWAKLRNKELLFQFVFLYDIVVKLVGCGTPKAGIKIFAQFRLENLK